jgi:hypothetical protein
MNRTEFRNPLCVYINKQVWEQILELLDAYQESNVSWVVRTAIRDMHKGLKQKGK